MGKENVTRSAERESKVTREVLWNDELELQYLSCANRTMAYILLVITIAFQVLYSGSSMVAKMEAQAGKSRSAAVQSAPLALRILSGMNMK